MLTSNSVETEFDLHSLVQSTIYVVHKVSVMVPRLVIFHYIYDADSVGFVTELTSLTQTRYLLGREYMS